MSNWPTEVGTIVDGSTSFSADSLGVLINNLTRRTEWLKTAVDSTTVNSPSDTDNSTNATVWTTNTGFILHDTGFSPTCSVGMVVAWHKSSGLYVPAIAKGTGELRSDGTEIPADEAYALGVLLSLDAETTGGTILCYGCTDDPNIIAKLIGDYPAPGDYYLSSEEPGEPGGRVHLATYSENRMSSYCLTCLYSTDRGRPTIFVRPYPPAYNSSPELRSVVTEDDSPLQVTTTGGVARITLNSSVAAAPNGTGRALCSITKDGFVSTPVVNTVTAGPGIIVGSGDSVGEVVVSTATAVNSELDLNLCALDGVYLSTSNTNSVIYTFPAGVSSALSGVIRVPYIGGTSVNGRVNILLEGSGASSALSTLEVTVQETTAAAGTNTIPAGVPLVYSVNNVNTANMSEIYKISVGLTQTLGSNALVYVKLSSSANPTNPTKVLSVSLELVMPGAEV